MMRGTGNHDRVPHGRDTASCATPALSTMPASTATHEFRLWLRGAALACASLFVVALPFSHTTTLRLVTLGARGDLNVRERRLAGGSSVAAALGVGRMGARLGACRWSSPEISSIRSASSATKSSTRSALSRRGSRSRGIARANDGWRARSSSRAPAHSRWASSSSSRAVRCSTSAITGTPAR